MTEADKAWLQEQFARLKSDVQRLLLESEARMAVAQGNFKDRIAIQRQEPVHGYEELTKRATVG